MEVEVWVELDGLPARAGTHVIPAAGTDGSGSFWYTPDYLATPGAYALDPLLPLGIERQLMPAGQELFGAMADSTPDGWGRSLLDRREAALAEIEHRDSRSLREIDYLLAVRDDLREGALRFRVGEGPFLTDEEAGVPGLADLPALLDLAAKAEADAADLADLQRLVWAGSSLGGARPKTHVLDNNGRISIAKLPSAGDRWNVMAWEKVVLDLAAAAAVEVAPSRLVMLDGRSVLVTERFDRTARGGRLGYLSAMTMLEPNRAAQRTYLDFAELVRRVSPRPAEELSQLWRRMVFFVLVSNTDNHLRNHGFLHEPGDGWRMSPAFDVNPDPDHGPTFLATPIADDADDTLDSALAVARHFGLTAEQAARVSVEVTEAVSEWQRVATAHGLSRTEMWRMAPAFAALSEASRV